MLTDVSLLGFIVASLVVLVLPGPGVLYVVARSVGQGRRAGLLSAFGLSVGVLAHVVAAAVGLSTILLTSATAFNIVKMLGAGYLIYLGIRTLLASRPAANAAIPAPLSPYRLFADGVVVSVLNPKIAVFFLAYLPQFVDPSRGAVAQQIVLLGLIYAVLAFLTDSSYALLAGSVRHKLSGRLLQGPIPKYVSGGLYLGLGVNAALTGRRL